MINRSWGALYPCLHQFLNISAWLTPVDAAREGEVILDELPVDQVIRVSEHYVLMSEVNLGVLKP